MEFNINENKKHSLQPKSCDGVDINQRNSPNDIMRELNWLDDIEIKMLPYSKKKSRIETEKYNENNIKINSENINDTSCFQEKSNIYDENYDYFTESSKVSNEINISNMKSSKKIDENKLKSQDYKNNPSLKPPYSYSNSNQYI